MKILALEFSTEWRSAAAAQDGHVLGAAHEETPRALGPTVLMERALTEAGWTPAHVEVVAVGLGPGSYHGVRVAIAVAQAWELGRCTRLIGVDSSNCLALQAHQAGLRGPLSVVISAQRGEWYHAGYVLGAGGPVLTMSLRLASALEVRARVELGDTLVGPDPFADPDPRATPVSIRRLIPDASAVARLAAGRSDFSPGAALEPVYLRPALFAKTTRAS